MKTTATLTFTYDDEEEIIGFEAFFDPPITNATIKNLDSDSWDKLPDSHQMGLKAVIEITNDLKEVYPKGVFNKPSEKD